MIAPALGKADQSMELPKCILKGIQRRDTQRFEVAQVARENRQPVINRRGCDGDVREAGRKASSAGIAG